MKEMETNIMVRFGNLSTLKDGGASNFVGKTVRGGGRGGGCKQGCCTCCIKFEIHDRQTLSGDVQWAEFTCLGLRERSWPEIYIWDSSNCECDLTSGDRIWLPRKRSLFCSLETISGLMVFHSSMRKLCCILKSSPSRLKLLQLLQLSFRRPGLQVLHY